MAEEKTPQQVVKEAVWWYTQVAFTLLAVLGAGYYLGYLQWGDAPKLKKRVTQLEQDVVKLRNEREALNSQLALVTRDRDDCKKGGGAAAAAPPAGGEAAGGNIDGVQVE